MGVVGCGDARTAGGNSSEAGNPEIVGRLVLEGGVPAIAAHIRCVPVSLDPRLSGADSIRWSVTDSSGTFVLDSLPEEPCNFEAEHLASAQKLRIADLSPDAMRSVHVFGELHHTGSLRLGISEIANGDSVWVSIPGSTYYTALEVQFASVIVESLAAGTYDSLSAWDSAGEFIGGWGAGVSINSGERTTLEAPPVRFEWRLELDTDGSGIQLTDTLLGFPLLVRLNSERVDFRYINQGTPLRVFRGDSLAELVHTIVRWDALAQEAELWIALDTLLPQDAGQFLTLVWDEAQPLSSAIAQSIFSVRAGFLAHWHFDEGPTEVRDAGEYGYDGRPHKVSSWPGTVGNGLWFDGRESYVTVPGTSTGPLNFGDSDDFTISVWANFHNPNTSRFVWSKGNFQYHFKYQHPDRWMFNYLDEQGSPYRSEIYVSSDSTVDYNHWVFLTVIKDQDTVQIYRNGELQSVGRSNNNTTDTRYTGDNFEIGRRVLLDGTMGQVFWGVLDELSIAGQVRSAEWIRLSYLNQRPEPYWP